MSKAGVAKVRNAVDTILREYIYAESADEREEIAAEIARLDGGGARLELAELGDRAWPRGGTGDDTA